MKSGVRTGGRRMREAPAGGTNTSVQAPRPEVGYARMGEALTPKGGALTP
jgi:hypothetical protein